MAEHAPTNQRGRFTAFIQTAATLGLLLLLLLIVIDSVQGYVDGAYADVPLIWDGAAVLMANGSPTMVKASNAWGWRVPFIGCSGTSVAAHSGMQTESVDVNTKRRLEARVRGIAACTVSTFWPTRGPKAIR